MSSDLIKHGLLVGVIATASTVVIDGTVSRIQALNGHPLLRGATRLGAAGGIAYGASKLKAPTFVIEGVIVGAVFVTALDIGISLIGQRRRLEPPPPQNMAMIGAPWAPSML
jgi:hypothetical protein